MGMYLVFFGKSQDFTSLYYDRNGWIADFNAVIRDFSLLESRVFTIDDINNKEILSRYFFTAQGKGYCLVKLYSLAQAMSGARIAGSIYGVGLLSDQAIDFSKENLDLLRAAKDNFAKLSLDGIKFNKSDFKSDADRIWNAIVSSKNGNLLDKISTQVLKVNGNEDPIALYVKNIFEEAVQLNNRIASFDTVYFSEDLPHLTRTQQKWGNDFFPIYKEENRKFVQYQEEVAAPIQDTKPEQSEDGPKEQEPSEEDKLQLVIDDLKYANECLEEDLEEIMKKQRHSSYLVFGLSGLLVLLLALLFFFDKIFSPEVPPQPKPVAVENPINQILVDSTSREGMINFLESIQLIYSHDIKSTDLDTTDLNEKYEEIVVFSAMHNLNIDTVREKFLEQKEIIVFENSAKTEFLKKKSKTGNEGN
jgi:hypothetical protein